MPHSVHSVQNAGSPVAVQLRRGAGRGRREDGVEAREQLVEALVEQRDAGQRLLVIERARPRARARAGRAAIRDSRSRPFSYSRSRFAAISASMIVRCQSQASAQRLGQRVFLALRRRASPASSANASRVSSSARSHTGVLTNASTRRQRRLLGRRLHERDARARPRVGIALVVAGELLGEQRDVLERAREHADVVERARELEDAVARDQSVRRLEAVDAAERGRPDDRAVGLVPSASGTMPAATAAAEPRRRAAGRVLRVVRIARLAGRDRWRTRWSRSCP